MSYVEKNLMSNEKILYSAQVNPVIFLPSVVSFLGGTAFIFLALTTKRPIFLYIIASIFFLLTARLAIEAWITILTTEFAITNKRIVAKTGFIHRTTLEMLLHKVESVSVYQNILGRWMDFGNITITGTGGTRETFRAIIAPVTVRKKVNQIIEHYEQAKL